MEDAIFINESAAERARERVQALPGSQPCQIRPVRQRGAHTGYKVFWGILPLTNDDVEVLKL